MMIEVVEDLIIIFNEVVSVVGVVGGMVDFIIQVINQLDEGLMGELEGFFVDY